MSQIALQMMASGLVSTLGWALLHFVWQGLIVGAVAGVLLFLLRGASPRWRYAVCALALAVCLGLPLLNLAWLLSQLGEGGAGVSPGLAEQTGWLQTLQAQMPALVTAWSLGVSLMALRLSAGLAWVGRLRHQAVSAPAVWQARLDALALRLNLRRAVPLLIHPSLSSPVTLGFWRPVVLLPAALLSGLPVTLLEALLAHELAHVRRWDYLANLLQSGVESLLFFHPVVWWLSTRLRAERELVADELAAQALDDPRCLAEALHQLAVATQAPLIAKPHSPSPLILSARGGSLLKRIERLMAPPPETASWKLALPAVLLACTSLLVQAHGQPPVAQSRPAIKSATAVAATPTATPTVSATPSNFADAEIASLLKLPVNARHVLVLDDSGRKVLLAKDADAVVPIASLSKLMTAMVLLDAKLDPNQMLRITHDDVDLLKHSRSFLPVGSEMPRGAALKMALMASENRAAAALARTYPGGINAFELALQTKIHALGLTHTTLRDPTGLSPANTSTATEVAMIAAAAARYPEIAAITSDKKAEIDINGRPRELHNTNRLVGNKGWDILLSKTGYTEEAGRCLTMRMLSGGKNVTVVLLDEDGSQQRMSDASKIHKTLDKLPAKSI